MECQGYKEEKNIIYQDNKSAMILEMNGKASSSKKNETYKGEMFFIKDKVDQGEIKVKYFPLEQMCLDVLTKPLQGQQFRIMRAMIMNCPVDYDETRKQNKDDDTKQTMIPQNKSVMSSQECVGNGTKIPHTILPDQGYWRIMDPRYKLRGHKIKILKGYQRRILIEE